MECHRLEGATLPSEDPTEFVSDRNVQGSVGPGRQSCTRDWNGFVLLVPLNYFLQGTSEKSRNFQGSQDLWSWIDRRMQ